MTPTQLAAIKERRDVRKRTWDWAVSAPPIKMAAAANQAEADRAALLDHIDAQAKELASARFLVARANERHERYEAQARACRAAVRERDEARAALLKPPSGGTLDDYKAQVVEIAKLREALRGMVAWHEGKDGPVESVVLANARAVLGEVAL